jgi:hypothetical protein
MQVAFKVFTTLFFVSLMLGSLLMAAVDFGNASDVESFENNPFGKLALVLSPDQIGTPEAWRLAGSLWLVQAAFSVVGIVATFLKKHRFGLVIGIGMIIFAVIVTSMQPSIETNTGNDPKVTGMGIAFFGVIGMLLLILIHTVMKPKGSTRVAAAS